MSTGIPYVDEVVNAVVGCTPIAAGCQNCWARELHQMRHMAHFMGKKVPSQYAKPFSEVQLLPERIEKVLHWRKPRRIFWCSTSDMFHKDVPNKFRWMILNAVRHSPQHTHLWLTKRIKNALTFTKLFALPLPQNLWLGISCSRQKDLDEMAPILFQIPAAHCWLSAEPLLEDLKILKWLMPGADGLPAEMEQYHDHFDWVVVGCESGSNRRPCNIEWVQSIMRQCKDAGVAVYVKQLDIRGKVVTDPKDFPEDMRIREIPKDK